MKKKMIWVVACLALFSGVVLSVTHADGFQIESQYVCQTEGWSSPLSYDKDGLLKGVITSLCQAPKSTRQGLISLGGVLIDETVKTAQIIHSGPRSGNYQGMPATRYDITTRFDGDSDTMSIRSDLFVATDQVKRLIYANLSKKVSGSGAANYIKKLDIFIETVPDGKAGYYFRLSAAVILDKPFFLPEDSFKSQADQALRKQYLKSRSEWAPKIADAL